MQRLFVLAGALALALAVVVTGVKAEDKDEKKDKPKNIKEVMKKAHAGDSAFKTVVGKAIKAKDFDDDAKNAMKAWVAIGSALGEFDPPRGEKESWTKQTKKYAEDLKKLAKAVNDKDAEAAATAFDTVDKGCGACHSKHKPKKK